MDQQQLAAALCGVSASHHREQVIILRARAVGRLATGAFTPFLLASWGEAEQEAVRRPVDASAEVEQQIASALGGTGEGGRVFSFSSARAAICAALEAARLPAQSEVLMPSFLCSSVAVAVQQAGFRPVLVDIDDDFNIRLGSVLEADGPAVRAVILAHLAGRWVRDADAIVSWARQRGVFVIDDAAQAFGLTVGGRAAGTLGDVGVFSSGAGKPIFGPGGGWLVTRSAELASNLAGQPLPRETDAAAKQRLHSFVRRFTRLGARRGQRFLMEALTFRFRGQPAGDFSVMAMNDLDAAVARPQVSNIAAAIQQRGRCADRWRALLRSVPLGELRVPSGRDTIHTNLVVSSAPGLRRVLWAHGVETEAWYTPLHLRSPFDRLRRTALPNTERQWQGTFGVPVRPNLTERDWVRIERAVEHAAQLSNGRGR